MKDTPLTQESSVPSCNKSTSPARLATAAIIAFMFVSLSAQAGSFFSDFNSGTLPAGTAVYGVATNDTSGGYTNSGCIKLTTVAGGSGALIIDDLDAGQPVVGFTATYKALIGGGTGADGMSFSFANDIPAGAITEDGVGSGLRVEFDTFKNADPDTAPSIDVWVGGNRITNMPVTLRANAFVDVVIQLRPDGTLMVIYNGVYAYLNLDVSAIGQISGGQFAFGARTGGSTDNHFIDNLTITTQNTNAFLASFSPVNSGIRPDAVVNLMLTDYGTAVDTNTIKLLFDGGNVTSSSGISQANTNTFPYTNTFLSFDPPGLMASSSTHTVSVTFADSALPPNTNTFQYSFTVSAFSYLNTNLAASASLVSTNPGFVIRVSQIDVNLGPTIQRAEKQLANLLIDPSTSLPYDNHATPNPENSSFIYDTNQLINFSLAHDQGSIGGDGDMPGIPGTTAGTANIALDTVAYLFLTPGFYQLGVNSSDGFRLTAASNPDLYATQEAVFDGVRAAADTTTTFGITLAGYYPFRILYFAGGVEAVNPGTLNPSLEFFSVDVNGMKTLINDTNVVGYVSAWRPAATLPYIRTLSPAPGDTAVPQTTAIDASLVNGTITVQTNTILLQVNGITVSPILATNADVTTIHYQPGTPFALNSTNNVLLAFTDSTSFRRTNSWQFVTENILTSLWAIPPTGSTNATWAKWVTTAGTERGLAYNPKTGHVLLVSRNSATGADGPNGLGVAVLDGNTGIYIKQLNLGSGVISSAGSGITFALNMIDVADDGVIYICNLTTTAAGLFRIYRWQDENASPTVAYSAGATGGSVRVGDDFSVRGSGAGTQIIASGNSAVNTIPIFTTTDGTNFNVTTLTVSSLPNASVRLGIAWGCGNTFYGETTGNGSDMRYATFTGPPSTVASLAASYRLVDKGTNQAIGPIAVDIANQRVIGDATSGASGVPHSMNLYDLSSLALSTATNLPIDSKTFPTSVGTFGTGSVDFTPDGTRLYTLDSGSGIIAFNLNPKAAAPSICYQPQNFIAPAGNIGFLGVSAIGSLQQFQWRLNGTNVPAATNRTLDTYYIGPTNIGRYTVVITNVLGSVTSSVAILDSTMVITNQPASQIVAIGGTATFNVGVSNGLPAYTNQWRLNGTNIVSTATTLTINNAQVANAGAYTVIVGDSLGQSATSSVAVLTVGIAGTGDGLLGEYYNLAVFAGNPPNPFTGLPVFTRVDPTININFGAGSPDPSVNVDYFTARWSGQVQPFYSQTYNFYTSSDDGSRVWVNGRLVVTNWFTQGPTERSGPSIALTANQKYGIVMEYYEQAVGAVATLSWSSAAQTKGIIPQSQLYSAASSPARPVVSSALVDASHLSLSWNGSYVLQTNGDLLNGTWATVTGATTPYTNAINPATPQLFYRLLSQ